MTPEEHLPLTEATFHIMLSLAETPRHGYGITQEVMSRTEGLVHLGPGTLYGRLTKMLEQGLIEELQDYAASNNDDERRRYYQLTDFGRQVANMETTRMVAMIKTARTSGIWP